MGNSNLKIVLFFFTCVPYIKRHTQLCLLKQIPSIIKMLSISLFDRLENVPFYRTDSVP